MYFCLYNVNNSCRGLIFFSPVEILPGLVCSSASFYSSLGSLCPSYSICSSSLMTVRPSGLACGPNTFYREPHFTSSQEQSSTLRMVSLSSVSRPEISLLALIQALNLLLARNFQSLGGVTLCFPGSWFHSEFNEGAELSGQRRVSPPGISLQGLRHALVHVK